MKKRWLIEQLSHDMIDMIEFEHDDEPVEA